MRKLFVEQDIGAWRGAIHVSLLAVALLGGIFTGKTAADSLSVLRTEPSGIPWDASTLENADKVIYGTDDRIDVYEETDEDRLAWAAATCAIVHASHLVAAGGDMYTLSVSDYLVSGKPPCEDEPFGNQPTAAFCSAFMVADDLIATAGHCFSPSGLQSIRFLFGFDMLDATTPTLSFHNDQIYTGVETLSYVSSGARDHAVVRVDRPIVAPGARPLPLRQTGTIGIGENIGVIGHPWGLPKKISFGPTTIVRDNSPLEYFIANLDTFAGNSGSPVFNADTGLVEGILVRGDTDFFIIENVCFRSNVFPDDGGSGEAVTRSIVFAAYIYGLPGEGEPAEGELTEGEYEGEPAEGEGEGEPEEGEGENDWLPVPNLVNLSRDTAETLLAANGFVLGEIMEECHDTIPTNHIISQAPKAGTLAPPGTSVAITISLGTLYVNVPDLTSKMLTDAEAALLDAGLQLGMVYEEYHPKVAVNRVISQNPAAGSEALRYSLVDLTVSKGPEPNEGEGEHHGGNVSGCCNLKQERALSIKFVEQWLGDWLLVGLALLALAKMRM